MLKVGPLPLVLRYCLALLFITGIGQAAFSQQTANLAPLLLPAPPELMAQMETQSHEYSEVKHFPPAKSEEETGQERTVLPSENMPNKVERMETLIAANEHVLSDASADKTAKDKAKRELRLQRLKLKIRAAEALPAGH